MLLFRPSRGVFHIGFGSTLPHPGSRPGNGGRQGGRGKIPVRDPLDTVPPPPPPPPPLDRLTAALAAVVVAALTLTATVAHAQTVGQSACPTGVTQRGFATQFNVSDVTADRATLRGGNLTISRRDITSLPDVTGNWPSDWRKATLYTGVRGYGYSDSDRDARSFGDKPSNQIQVQDGDLIHGAWLHAGTIEFNELTLRPSTVLGLIPSTKYVAQLVVGELRNSRGKVVTNQFALNPKPVVAQVCFQTAASPS